MEILGIIAEYNPFHLGHKYHLEESKKVTGADYSIALMSGSFVQRGEPAIIDKFYRAKSALLNGFDLVIELPFIYSSQTAEIFSRGSIKILDSLNIVDYLAFGSEYNDINVLNKIASPLAEENLDYQIYLRKNLSKGISYPTSRVLALKEYFKDKDSYLYKNLEEILSGSNNILAIEYLKELSRLKSSIEPITIKREGNDYRDNSLGDVFSSASSIRKSIFENNKDSIACFTPDSSMKLLEDFYCLYGAYNSLDNYYDFLNYRLTLTSRNKLAKIFDLGEDLGNRFLNEYHKAHNMSSLIDLLVSKNYTRSRIQRAIINILLENYYDSYEEIIYKSPNFIRILASNKKGFEIIGKIKKESDTIIINRFSDYLKYKELYPLMELEKKATDLYYLGLLNRPFVDMDFRTSPYIKK